jgi:Transposase and inactivated derivatives
MEGEMMGNVLKMDRQQVIQGLIRLNWSDRAIHKETGIHRKTISLYRKQFQNVPEVPTDSNGPTIQNVPQVPADPAGTIPRDSGNDIATVPPPTHSQKIMPHREAIRTDILSGLTAQRIYQDLVEQYDFSGSYDSVKRYVRKFKKRHKRFFERLPTLPGREAQVDFAKSPCKVLVNGKYRHVWFFKMTLSHSRHSYEELVVRQDVETFIRCHERAFKSFNGVPETIKLDNLKAGVIQACLYDPVINPVYQAFAQHAGFVPNPCAPAMPHHKGHVERDIQYTESNALAGRRFESIEEGNIFLRHWNKRWAQTRIHGTTKCQVWKHFVETEQPKLRPLPTTQFTLFSICIRKVDVSGLVEVGCNFYAAPAKYVGDLVTVHHNSIDVKIYARENGQQQSANLLVRHKTLQGKGHYSQPSQCRPFYKHPTLEDQEMYYCRKARQIGQSCYAVVYRILATNDPLAIRRVRGILSLPKKFDPELVEQSCSMALFQQSLSYRTIKALCETVAKKGEPDKLPLTQEHDAIRPLHEYQTIIEERTQSI